MTMPVSAIPQRLAHPSSLSQTRLGWYLTRARVMRPSELMHRLTQAAHLSHMAVADWIGPDRMPGIMTPWDQLRFCTATTPQLPKLEWRNPVTEHLTDTVLAGRLPGYSFDWSWANSPESWHRAPDTGRIWPLQFFATISYRAGNPYGDIRAAWEPSRLQQLVVLARAAACQTGDSRRSFVAALKAQLLSWIEANPPYRGIHYISAMECGLRIVAVCHALDMTRSWIETPEPIWSGLTKLIFTHAKLIRKRISRHSSSGNHTVAEATGLLYAGILFPELPHASDWRNQGLQLLTNCASYQILPSGEGTEQAVHYLAFVSDLFGLACALLRHHGIPTPMAIAQAHERSQRYLEHLCPNGTILPQLGDSDSGYALSPDLVWPSLKSPAPSEPAPDNSAHVTVFRASFHAPVQAIWDHGPLGMPPCYGHGHADALALTISVGGEPFIVDSGTYTYTGDALWRTYFRGTRAHNTVVVNDQDQAIQLSPFMWDSPFTCRLLRYEPLAGSDRLAIAEHDGYLSRFGVRHIRAILFRSPGTWIILDRLQGTGSHSLELNWHLAIPLESCDTGFVGRSADYQLHMTIQGGVVDRLVGSLHPIRGWHSSQYGVRTPISTVFARYRGPLPFDFLTHITVTTRFTESTDPADVTLLRRILDETGAN